jgi:copper chaperone NosL
MRTRAYSRRIFLGSAVLAPVVLIGCGGQEVDLSQPPQITLGRDTCDGCGMIISDERYAAGLVAPDGTASLFDDVGEMLQALGDDKLGERRAWVHDWNSREWIDATTGSYVRGEEAVTPMGFGIVAFGAREDAEAFAVERGAPILTWDEVVALDL